MNEHHKTALNNLRNSHRTEIESLRRDTESTSRTRRRSLEEAEDRARRAEEGRRRAEEQCREREQEWSREKQVRAYLRDAVRWRERQIPLLPNFPKKIMVEFRTPGRESRPYWPNVTVGCLPNKAALDNSFTKKCFFAGRCC